MILKHFVQIEEVLNRIMKDEEERGKTEKKRGDLAKKFMLKWVEKKNNGSEGRTKFDIPKVNFNFLKVF